jgi:hypothetical protein
MFVQVEIERIELRIELVQARPSSGAAESRMARRVSMGANILLPAD